MKKSVCCMFTVVFAFILAAGGCQRSDVEKIDLEKKVADVDKAPNSKPNVTPEKGLRIAVGGMITPKEGFKYYKDFLDYIGDKLGQKIEFVDREDYAEINKLLKQGDVDVAFVCGGPYVDGKKDFDLELLVAPQAYGGTVYYSYIIVPKDSPVKDFSELRGKVFGFTDPLSNTGKLVPTYMLAQMNETPEGFFKKFIFTKSHDKAIRAVAEKIVDAAAVDSLIFEYASRNNPEFTSKTRVIVKSPPYGIPPVVVRPGLDPSMKAKLKRVFLDADKDPKGFQILKGMMVDRFVVIYDDAYSSIRDMKAWFANQKK